MPFDAIVGILGTAVIMLSIIYLLHVFVVNSGPPCETRTKFDPDPQPPEMPKRVSRRSVNKEK